MAINELQFQGRLLVWIAEILRQNADLRFSRAEQNYEVTIAGTKRQLEDMAIIDLDGNVVCLVQLKFPDNPDGGYSPRDPKVVYKIQGAANELGAPYFVTWNVNSAVLWKTDIPHRMVLERSLKSYAAVAAVKGREDTDSPPVESAARDFLKELLADLAGFYTGRVRWVAQPVDEAFAQTMQSYLDPALVGTNAFALRQRYTSDSAFAEALRKWAVDDQGWTWAASPEDIERTTRLACLLLVNKVVFYEALRKAYKGFEALVVPVSVKTGQDLQSHLNGFFQKVVDNRDYETVFTPEGVIDEVPFLVDKAVPLWVSLLEAVERYDFARLDYEVIGNIFQRLIAPDERHNFGQYFTRSDAVDLINAFCIRTPDAAVLDPGCGAGTFLVRAYARLRALAEREGVTWTHKELLANLWGVDISRYPAHLTTINLAVRDLASPDNYPRILHRDFFQVSRGRPVKVVQRSYKPLGPPTEKVKVPLPAFDAVVGNPPYTRQEEMEEIYQGMKDRGHEAVGQDWKLDISRRSSIYALFLLHAAAFLKEGGYLGMVTHSSWLDVDYGKHLQEFFLTHFQIVAVMEPAVEHWFPDADINTAITIVRRCSDKAARDGFRAKFVTLKVPLRELVTPGDETGRQRSLEALVRRIEAADRPAEDPFLRIYPVSQAELWREGLNDEGKYAGAKWGKYLRAPPVFFKMMQRAGDRLCRLGDISEVKRGFTTGANEFFYVKDITDALTDDQLVHQHGLTRRQAARVRVVETGDGERHLIEAEFLRPLIKSTRDVVSLRVDPSWVKFHALIVNRDKRRLRGTHVLKYIRLGETQTFGHGPRSGIPAHKPTCRSRNPWYALDESNKGRFLWFYLITDAFAVPHNQTEILADNRFFNVRPHTGESENLLFGLLNSTFTFLCAELWGRQFAGRGIDSIDIKVYEVAALPMVDPHHIDPEVAERIERAVERIARRPILPVLEEVHQPDRQALDEAVLEAMGFSDAEEKAQVLVQLYNAVCDKVRKRFERARSAHPTGGRVRPSAEALARELSAEFPPDLVRSFPTDFVPAGTAAREVALPTEPVEVELLTPHRLRLGADVREYANPGQAELVYLAARSGVVGIVLLPTSQAVLREAVSHYRQHMASVEATLDKLASSRTKNRKLKEAIKEQLRRLLALAPPEPAQPRLI
ncbi:MAG: SAM-dependent DNA methyltransferase [Chloroflexi bacterium]|nr:SAM-dependent DNA methyltransferase [Chloroflexota bacterium]